jgi:hypothetical protein
VHAALAKDHPLVVILARRLFAARSSSGWHPYRRETECRHQQQQASSEGANLRALMMERVHANGWLAPLSCACSMVSIRS